jgi:hypothetical protein
LAETTALLAMRKKLNSMETKELESGDKEWQRE